MAEYYFKEGKFIIENYNNKNPFANFLPGVAGKMGIPLWAFYVNRAQGISGYGLQDKNHPISVFSPANKAYECVAFDGFRTFIKTDNTLYEAFKVDSNYPHKMAIDQSSFSIEEVNSDLGLQVNVTYFGLANAPIAGLVRKVEITNISSHRASFEMLDGIAEILPSGIQNEAFKSVSNVLASWIDVNHFDDNLAFYRLRGSTGDSSEVKEVKDGNFYLGFTEQGLITPIVDKNLVFGQNTAKSTPLHFMNHGLDEIVASPQYFANKIPCGFIPVNVSLEKGETFELYALSGHTKDIELLREVVKNFAKKEIIDQKQIEAAQVIDEMLKDVHTQTANPVFDHYVKQNYLDNILRGGYPEKIGNSIYHLYSRRHGDLERDYNFFSLAPEYYSQGNGNFRDVCQNRRMDSFINKDVERFNIYQFASLIQLDGYNPLSINGILFTLKESIDQEALVNRHFECDANAVLAFLKTPFTPGKIVNYVERNNLHVKTDTESYLNDIINHSTSSINANFGEGFWIDHFTYIIDLVETFESIYPDKMDKVLFNDTDYAYFDSPVSVKPLSEKIMLNSENKVRQYSSLRHFDQEKIELLKMNPYTSN
ncbi:MAG: cellobiose phosphorylase, partial [Candidatus Izemoplasmataceae bacterium]